MNASAALDRRGLTLDGPNEVYQHDLTPAEHRVEGARFFRFTCRTAYGTIGALTTATNEFVEDAELWREVLHNQAARSILALVREQEEAGGDPV